MPVLTYRVSVTCMKLHAGYVIPLVISREIRFVCVMGETGEKWGRKLTHTNADLTLITQTHIVQVVPVTWKFRGTFPIECLGRSAEENTLLRAKNKIDACHKISLKKKLIPTYSPKRSVVYVTRRYLEIWIGNVLHLSKRATGNVSDLSQIQATEAIPKLNTTYFRTGVFLHLKRAPLRPKKTEHAASFPDTHSGRSTALLHSLTLRLTHVTTPHWMRSRARARAPWWGFDSAKTTWLGVAGGIVSLPSPSPQPITSVLITFRDNGQWVHTRARATISRIPWRHLDEIWNAVFFLKKTR